MVDLCQSHQSWFSWGEHKSIKMFVCVKKEVQKLHLKIWLNKLTLGMERRMRQHTPSQGLKVRIPWMQKYFPRNRSPLFIWEGHCYLWCHFCPSQLVASLEHVVVQPPSLGLWTNIKNKQEKLSEINDILLITEIGVKTRTRLNNGLNQYTLPFFDRFLGHNSPCSVNGDENAS